MKWWNLSPGSSCAHILKHMININSSTVIHHSMTDMWQWMWKLIQLSHSLEQLSWKAKAAERSLITFLTTSFVLVDNAESKRKEVLNTEISKRMGERELGKQLVVHVEACKWKRNTQTKNEKLWKTISEILYNTHVEPNCQFCVNMLFAC